MKVHSSASLKNLNLEDFIENPSSSIHNSPRKSTSEKQNRKKFKSSSNDSMFDYHKSIKVPSVFDEDKLFESISKNLIPTDEDLKHLEFIDNINNTSASKPASSPNKQSRESLLLEGSINRRMFIQDVTKQLEGLSVVQNCTDEIFGNFQKKLEARRQSQKFENFGNRISTTLNFSNSKSNKKTKSGNIIDSLEDLDTPEMGERTNDEFYPEGSSFDSLNSLADIGWDESVNFLDISDTTLSDIKICNNIHQKPKQNIEKESKSIGENESKFKFLTPNKNVINIILENDNKKNKNNFSTSSKLDTSATRSKSISSDTIIERRRSYSNPRTTTRNLFSKVSSSTKPGNYVEPRSSSPPVIGKKLFRFLFCHFFSLTIDV
jgi:hypothetical protein